MMNAASNRPRLRSFFFVLLSASALSLLLLLLLLQPHGADYVSVIVRHATAALKLTSTRSDPLCWRNLSLPEGNVNTFTFSFRHQPACRAKVDLLVLVTSAPMNWRRRQAIRATWGSPGRSKRPMWPSLGALKSTVRVVFMIAESGAASVDRDVSLEAQRESDLLVGFYKDSYRNLTLKVLLGLGWTCARCPARFVAKTDDDIFFNLPRVFDSLTSAEHRPGADDILGCHLLGKPIREGKLGISVAEYPCTWYPHYVGGYAYAMRHELSCRLFQEARLVRLLPFEDVFITGILRVRLGARVRHEDGWYHTPYPAEDVRRRCCNVRRRSARAKCVQKAFSRRVSTTRLTAKEEIWRHLHGNFAAGCRSRAKQNRQKS